MSANTICKAIAGRLLISFHYKGVNRSVEPHCVGRDSKGNLLLSAWQLSGGSGVGWRDFKIDDISGLVVSDKSFSNPRPGYNPNDQTLSQILCCL